MRLKDIGKEFWRRLEQGSRLGSVSARRAGWPSKMSIQFFRDIAHASRLVTVVESFTVSGAIDSPFHLYMNLQNDGETVVSYWCPSAEDAIADDWSLAETGR